MRYAFQQIAMRGRAEAVRNYLRYLATSWAPSQRNGWRTATYEALAASDWFCASFAGWVTDAMLTEVMAGTQQEAIP